MVISKCHAKEKRLIEEIISSLPIKKDMAAKVLKRLNKKYPLPNTMKVLDIGASQGELVAIFREMGYACEGVEPLQQARETSIALSRHLGIPFTLFDGCAENIPFDADAFDLVIASSVIEHVLDVDKSFSEIFRVLKPGGVFWFNAASALCPFQKEITGFPLFGWYPDRIKLRVMQWAKKTKPHLVGYTDTPAINWFTPRKAFTLLHRHGFQEVVDRWDLILLDKGGLIQNAALHLIKQNKFLRLMADICLEGCVFAARK